MAEAADWILHSATGGLFGVYFSPLVAFIMGFVSHIILDLYVYEFSPFPLAKYYWWLIIQVVVVGALLLISPISIIFGILGGLAPDIIDGLQGLFLKPDGSLNIPSRDINRWLAQSRWNRGIMFFPWHIKKNMRVDRMLELEVNILIALFTLFILLFTKTRKK